MFNLQQLPLINDIFHCHILKFLKLKNDQPEIKQTSVYKQLDHICIALHKIQMRISKELDWHVIKYHQNQQKGYPFQYIRPLYFLVAINVDVQITHCINDDHSEKELA